MPDLLADLVDRVRGEPSWRRHHRRQLRDERRRRRQRRALLPIQRDGWLVLAELYGRDRRREPFDIRRRLGG